MADRQKKHKREMEDDEKSEKRPWIKWLIVAVVVLIIGYVIYNAIGSVCADSSTGLCRFAEGVGSALGAVGDTLSWVGDNFQILLFSALGAVGIYAAWTLISPRAKAWNAVREAAANPKTEFAVTREGLIGMRDGATGKLLVNSKGEPLKAPETVKERIRVREIAAGNLELASAVGRASSYSLLRPAMSIHERVFERDIIKRVRNNELAPLKPVEAVKAPARAPVRVVL